MIFRVTMKDPDSLYDGIEEALDLPENRPTGIDDGEWKEVKERRKEKYSDIASQWFTYGEYLTVEIDTDKRSIEVIKE